MYTQSFTLIETRLFCKSSELEKILLASCQYFI